MTRKKTGVLFFVLLALFVAVAGGGCGGSGSGTSVKEQGIMIGTPHGEMGQYLQESLNSLGGVVLLSAPEGLTASHESLPHLRKAFDQGKAAGLVHADKEEVNVLLDALSVDIDYPELEDGNPVELFAVRKMSNGLHFFVTLNDDTPVSEDVTERTITIVGPEEAPTSVDVSSNVVKKKINVDNSTVQNTRVGNFISWAQETDTAEAKVSDSSSNLRDLAEAYVWDIDASYQGQSFTIRYTLYSCHSFTNSMDYYFVTQEAQLNPSALWKWVEKGHVSYPNIYLPKQEGHMRRYLFKNYWGEDPGNAVPLEKPSPENANNVTTVTSGVSYNLSGSLGFNSQGATGSLSGGATFSNSQSFSVSDCTVNNEAGSDSRKHQAAWEYVFANPANGSTKFYYTELKDAPLLSRSSFQPVNQWIWTVPRTFSEKWDNLRFKSEFTWTDGVSEGQLNCVWIKVDNATHRDWKQRYLGFWVPVKKPPLMAVSAAQMDFTKAGESKAVTFVSALDWNASTDAEWLSVQEKSGQKTDAEGMSLHITAAPNNNGANREATVTLLSTNGKEKQTLKVFQSQY